MKLRIQLILAVLLSVSCHGAEIISEVVSKVALSGEISHTWAYGPPNFGENPESDTKEQYWLLSLDHPIKMKDEDGSIVDVTKIQLIVSKMPTGSGNLKSLNSKHIQAFGDIFLASTGHHHEKAVLILSSITEIKK
jgi:hypothetical protein